MDKERYKTLMTKNITPLASFTYSYAKSNPLSKIRI